MSQRLEEFLRELPARGVPDHAVQLYRTVLEDFEAFLGKAAQLRFSRYEISRFVAQRQRANASEKELKNITTACAAYLSYCEAQAPPPAVGTAAEPAAGPTAIAEAPPPAERRKVLFIAGGVAVLLFGLIAGCIADKARQARVERAYSDELAAMGAACTGNRDLLRQQVFAAAERRGITLEPANVALGVSPLAPDNVNKLPMGERMRAMAALQARARVALPPPGADGLPRRHHVDDEPLWYVEINVIGDIGGLFGKHRFDLALHLLGGKPAPTAPPG